MQEFGDAVIYTDSSLFISLHYHSFIVVVVVVEFGLDLFCFIGNILFRLQGSVACGFEYVNIFSLNLLWFDLVDLLPEIVF